ncbi:Aste57867_8327 [Aphanomyces stellatus]|uniref:Aste57867_8327 protein n=1 Tax=Aphanomyces stellatus TaxID=120398 RepID=A0A485KJY1_9STRA|nr:hypothetical protein As57867_008295 [Aphanomyces stellatus]VFT85214.1 Aste57867_8327 [Aphanomyces stellatus]
MPLETAAVTNIADVLSPEEQELCAMQFSLVNRRKNNRDLDKLETTQLFRDHAPEISPHELKLLLAQIEAKGMFQLNVNEYMQVHIKAAKKVELEHADEEDLKRHFTVLDYHGNGSLVATEITEALEKTGDPGVNVLKEAIVHATKLSEDGTITFELFRHAIHDMNRTRQSAIASGMVRLYRLKAKLLAQHSQPRRRVSVTSHVTSIQLEYDVLLAQTERQKAELITVQNDLFSRVYGIIVAQYMCQTRVLQAFENFFDHLHTEESHLFRHNLEKSGRVVTVHPSFLLTPGPEIEKSKAYAQLCDFMVPDVVYDSVGILSTCARRLTHGEQDNNGPIFTNRAYRKVFLWYCLMGSLTNFQTMSRSSFLRFAKDCRFADLSDRPILEPDLDACFVVATREPRLVTPKKTVDSASFHFHFQPMPQLFENAGLPTPQHAGGMNFQQWVHGTTLLLVRCLGLHDMPTGEAQDQLFRDYVLPKAHQLKTQPLGPEVSQPQVMRFIHKHVWPLKQLFSHFAGHSMTTIELQKGLPLRDFIHFARCFDILPSSLIEQPPTVNPDYRQLSLQEVVQEYNAAKLDVGFSKTESRESLDLNFHEFLRAIQRLALAMNRSSTGSSRGSTKHMSLVSSFQHFRSDMEGETQVHLFKHTRQLHAEERHMSKIVQLVRTRLTSQPSLLSPRAMTTSLVPQVSEMTLYESLPPLALEDVDPASPKCPKTSRTSSIRSDTTKCVTPKLTHLPIASPRYSAERPFSLGGSPHIKIVRRPPVLDPASPQPPKCIRSPRDATYAAFTVPPLSNRSRSRTPYEQASGVVVGTPHVK